MRIALLNNQYFMVGGTTRYLFNVQALLEERGHQVIPFSNRYPQTLPTPYERYFAEPPGGRDAGVLFKDKPMTLRRAWSLFVRGVYDFGVRKKFERLIEEEHIDLAYSVNICNFLGPSVIDAARRRGIPYVLRLSDFNLTCPSYHHLRNGTTCTACEQGLWNAVRFRCLQGNASVSLARTLAMWAHRLLRVYSRVTRIVTPSAFLRDSLTRAGFDANRIDHIPSLVELDRLKPSMEWSGNEVVYAGRLTPEKGVDTLIHAAGLLAGTSEVKVVLIGEGDPGYVSSLHDLARRVAPGRVEFTGFMKTEAALTRVGRAVAVAHPARWFENMPNSITEAMALARPVLASSLGSMPEQVCDGETGLLLDPASPQAWAQAMDRLLRDRTEAERMGRAGRTRAESDFSPEKHYRRLMDTFEKARKSCPNTQGQVRS